MAITKATITRKVPYISAPRALPKITDFTNIHSDATKFEINTQELFFKRIFDSTSRFLLRIRFKEGKNSMLILSLDKEKKNPKNGIEFWN